MVVTVTLLLTSGFVGNWAISAYELNELRQVQSLDPTLKFVRVPSALEPLQVRCEVRGTRIGTIFHIPGAGCSWVYNAVPMWPLPERLPGIEVCSFSRQGLAFTLGAPDNVTDAGVVAVTNQVVELISQLTDPALPLWLSGHSYGGVQAALVAKRLIDAKRRPAAVMLIDAAPVFVDPQDPAQLVWNDAVHRLSSLFGFLELLATFGIVRLFRAPLLAVGAPTALENVPPSYREAYLYAYAQPSNYGTLKADFERFLTTAQAARRAVSDAHGAPLLGDVRLELVQASPQRFPKDGPVAQDVIDALQAHNDRSLFSTMSSRANMRVIDEADHQFVSTPRAVKLFQDAIVEIVKSSK